MSPWRFFKLVRYPDTIQTQMIENPDNISKIRWLDIFRKSVRNPYTLTKNGDRFTDKCHKYKELRGKTKTVRKSDRCKEIQQFSVGWSGQGEIFRVSRSPIPLFRVRMTG